MPYKAERTKSFLGIGDGERAGECFMSVNMRRSRFGTKPTWVATRQKQSGTEATEINGLGLPVWFTQTSVHNYTIDGNGYIYRTNLSSTAWALYYDPSIAGVGQGMITDQKNRLLYAGTQYLGVFDNTTANYATGTVTATNGSATITGSGTTFADAHVGKRIRFGTETAFYTILAKVSATEITLSTNYAGTTGAGKTYAIFVGWTDQMKDGSAVTIDFVTNVIDYRPMDLYEDKVLIGNGNAIAMLSTTDDSFNASAFTLPTNMAVRCVKSGANGVLIGANLNGRGVLILWDTLLDRSSAPWIWLDSEIRSLAYDNGNWVAITTEGVFITNGLWIKPLATLPDKNIGYPLFSGVAPQGVLVRNQFIIIPISGSGFINRVKNGLWIFDKRTGLWDYVPFYSKQTQGVSTGGIFVDKNLYIHYGTYSGAPLAKYYIERLYTGLAASGQITTEALGTSNDNDKKAEGIIVNFGFDIFNYTNGLPDVRVTVCLHEFKEQLYHYAQAKVVGVELNKITINASLYNTPAAVGDKITILQGVNAGSIRFISSITGAGTETEVWTLDRDLSVVIEESAHIGIEKLKKIGTQQLDSAPVKNRYYFPVKNGAEGKKFLVNVILENEGNYNVMPEISSVTLVYNDLEE